MVREYTEFHITVIKEQFTKKLRQSFLLRITMFCQKFKNKIFTPKLTGGIKSLSLATTYSRIIYRTNKYRQIWITKLWKHLKILFSKLSDNMISLKSFYLSLLFVSKPSINESHLFIFIVLMLICVSSFLIFNMFLW